MDLLDQECQQLPPQTREKANALLAQYKALNGVIIIDIFTGERFYIEAGLVAKKTKQEAFAMMKGGTP